jgi:hypothetical protein
MPRNLLRKLSPKEESTLCRIAQGMSDPASLRPDDVSCLKNFGFVEILGRVPTLTPLGVQRVAIVTRATPTRSFPGGFPVNRPTRP